MWLKLLKLVGGIRAAIFLAAALSLFASTMYYKHSAANKEEKLIAQTKEYTLDLGRKQLEIDRLVIELADAKEDGVAAVAALKESEKKEDARLAAKQKEWERRYAKDKESRDWGNTPIPDAVVNGL